MVIYIFLKFGIVKVFKTLQTVSYVKTNLFQVKILNEIHCLHFIREHMALTSRSQRTTLFCLQQLKLWKAVPFFHWIVEPSFRNF